MLGLLKGIKETICILALVVVCASVEVLPVSASLNIREGALNEDVYGIIEGYKQGWISKSDLEDMLASGGFTDDAAEQVKTAIADPVTEQENAQQSEMEAETGIQSEGVSEDIQGQPEKSNEHEHSYTMELTSKPNCEKPGLKTFICKECGDTYTTEIPAIGHSEDEPVTEREPGCTQPGIRSYSCVLCGKELRQEEIPAVGHISGEKITVKEPTLFSKGREEVRCSKCGALLETSVIEIPKKYLSIDIILGIVTMALCTVLIIKQWRKHNEKKK